MRKEAWRPAINSSISVCIFPDFFFEKKIIIIFFEVLEVFILKRKKLKKIVWFLIEKNWDFF